MPSLHKVISDTLGTIYGGSIAANDDAASKVLRHILANGYNLVRTDGPLVSKPDPARDGAQPPPMNNLPPGHWLLFPGEPALGKAE